MHTRITALALVALTGSLATGCYDDNTQPAGGDTDGINVDSCQDVDPDDLDEDGRMDDAEQVQGPLCDYPGEVWISGNGFDDPYAYNVGMDVVCVTETETDIDEYTYTWLDGWWGYSGAGNPADVVYYMYVPDYADYGIWACGFFDSEGTSMLTLDVTDAMAYSKDSFCFSVSAHESDGTPVLERIENSDQCGRLDARLRIGR